jgi:hypothetical protein
MGRKRITRYDIVFSFSGKDQAVASQLYDALIRQKLDVYFYSKRNQFSEDLFRLTRAVFNSGASNAVVIVSRNYTQSYWARLEWDELQKAKKARRINKIFLVRLDDTMLHGLNAGEVYEVWENNPTEIGKKIMEQLGTPTRRVLRICVSIVVIFCILGAAWLFLFGRAV